MTTLFYILGIMPIPIPIHMGSGGSLTPNVLLAVYLGSSVFIFFGMLFRLFLVRNHQCFKKQSLVKNFFYELDDYQFLKPDLNMWAFSFVFIQGLALLVLIVGIFLKILDK